MSEDTPRTPILGPRRLAPRSPSNVSRNFCYYRAWDICAGKLRLTSPKDGSRGDEQINPTDVKKKLPLNVSRKFTLENAKPILLTTIFSLLYIVKLIFTSHLMRAIYGRLGRFASPEVFVHLLSSRCMPVLLYGLDSCPLKSLNYAHLRT